MNQKLENWLNENATCLRNSGDTYWHWEFGYSDELYMHIENPSSAFVSIVLNRNDYDTLFTDALSYEHNFFGDDLFEDTAAFKRVLELLPRELAAEYQNDKGGLKSDFIEYLHLKGSFSPHWDYFDDVDTQWSNDRIVRFFNIPHSENFDNPFVEKYFVSPEMLGEEKDCDFDHAEKMAEFLNAHGYPAVAVKVYDQQNPHAFVPEDSVWTAGMKEIYG